MLPVGNAMFGQRKPPTAPATGQSQIGDFLSALASKASTSTGVDAAGVWLKVQGSIGLVHVVLGVIMSLWALWAMGGLNAQTDALLLGALKMPGVHHLVLPQTLQSMSFTSSKPVNTWHAPCLCDTPSPIRLGEYRCTTSTRCGACVLASTPVTTRHTRSVIDQAF
jgi:hypothetical protein